MNVRCLLIGVVVLFVAGALITSSYAEFDPKTVAGAWLFDEGQGDIAKDSSANKNNGKLVSGPVRVDGKFGKALSFSGANYVEVPDSDSLNITEDITIITWLKGSKGAVITKLYSYWLGGNPAAANVLEFAFKMGGADILVLTANKLPENEWVHLAVTQEKKGQIIFYLNGEEIFKAQQATPRDRSAESLFFAKGAWGVAGFNGILDEVAIFNVVLGAADIKDIMSNGLMRGLAVAEPVSKLAAIWAAIKVGI